MDNNQAAALIHFSAKCDVCLALFSTLPFTSPSPCRQVPPFTSYPPPHSSTATLA